MASSPPRAEGGECCKSVADSKQQPPSLTDSAAPQACRHNVIGDGGDDDVQHPHAPFMARAIECAARFVCG